MSSRLPLSSWRKDAEEDRIGSTSTAGFGQGVLDFDHKIDEQFMARHGVQPGIKLMWIINQQDRFSDVFALAEADSFQKVKDITFGIATANLHLDTNIHALHIDKFIISFTDHSNMRIKTEIDVDEKTYRHTGTENSPETFNAFMRNITARISVLHNYCTCNSVENCNMAVHCPELRLFLSGLDEEHNTLHRNNKEKEKTDKAVNINKIVHLGSRSNFAKESIESESGCSKKAKVLIDVSCLRKLLGDAQRGRAYDRSVRNINSVRPNVGDESIYSRKQENSSEINGNLTLNLEDPVNTQDKGPPRKRNSIVVVDSSDDDTISAEAENTCMEDATTSRYFG